MSGGTAPVVQEQAGSDARCHHGGGCADATPGQSGQEVVCREEADKGGRWGRCINKRSPMCGEIENIAKRTAAELRLPRHRRGRLTGDGCALQREQTHDCCINNASAPQEAAPGRGAASGAQQSRLRERGRTIACVWRRAALRGIQRRQKAPAVTHRLAAALAKPQAPADPRTMSPNALVHLRTADNLPSKAGGGEGKALALLGRFPSARDGTGSNSDWSRAKITILMMPCTCIAALWLEPSDSQAGDANQHPHFL